MLKPKEKHSVSSRLLIIEKSTDLFLELGFSGTSMATIARACKMTKANIYHYFSGKEELFVACVSGGYTDALSDMKTLVDAEQPPAAKITRLLDIVYDTTVNSKIGQMSPLIAEVSRTIPEVARSFHDGYVGPQQDLVWKIVQQVLAAEGRASVDKRLFFHMFFGPVVTLSLSREMFSCFDDLDSKYPVEVLKKGHQDAIRNFLGLPS